MKKPQGAGAWTAAEPTMPPSGERRTRHWDPWIGLPGGMWTGALRAFDVWLRLWEQVWTAGLPPAMRGSGTRDAERRHAEDLPWVPRFEATVIPLRRRTDPPGAEATRLSMRLPMPPMPWGESGANVISVETIIGARRRKADEASDDASPASGKTDTPPHQPPHKG